MCLSRGETEASDLFNYNVNSTAGIYYKALETLLTFLTSNVIDLSDYWLTHVRCQFLCSVGKRTPLFPEQ
jgi:hypothetical protein